MGVWRRIRRSVPASIRKPVRILIGKLKGEKIIIARPPGPQLDGLNELAALAAAELGPKIVMVEVGSYQGESTEIFARHFPNGEIHAVDPFLPGYDDGDGYSYLIPMTDVERRFDERTRLYPQIVKIKKKSLDYAREIGDRTLDFVYVDGCHEYAAAKEDILAWLPKVRPGGILSGHDYLTWEEVRRAVHDTVGRPDQVFQDSSWCVRIKP